MLLSEDVIRVRDLQFSLVNIARCFCKFCWLKCLGLVVETVLA